MVVAATAARLVLAVVFGVAAVAKLTDRPGTYRALGDFGVPRPFIVAAGGLLIAAEIAVSLGLLFGASATIAACAALALLTAFTAAAGLALARGQSPDCHCFGQLRSRPVGAGTFWRNALLAAIAVLVLVLPAESLLAPVPMLLTAALATATVTLAGRQGARAEPFLNGLPVASLAPDIALSALSGESVALRSVVDAGKPAVLVRWSPDCGSCLPLLAQVGRWQQALSHDLKLVPISTGDPHRTRLLAQEHGVDRVYLAPGERLEEAYGRAPTPSALLIDGQSRVAAAPVAGALAVESLIRLALRRKERLDET